MYNIVSIMIDKISETKPLVIKIILVAILFFSVSTVLPINAKASVGLVDMRSTNQEEYRCFSSSLLMPNGRYDVAINCVNLIFPITPEVISTYIVWATPLNGKGPL